MYYLHKSFILEGKETMGAQGKKGRDHTAEKREQ